MKKSVEQRFWEKVNKTEGCWLWTAGPNNNRYGNFKVAGEMFLSHRFVWMLANGPIPNGMFVCHTCDVPRCVNPEHLFLGTPADNMLDKQHKGRCVVMQGEAHGRHKLTEAQVMDILELKGQALQKTIAEVFGISRSMVGMIHTRKNWRHIKGAPLE